MAITELLSSAAVPLIFSVTAAAALCRSVDIFQALVKGAKQGLGVVFKIFPGLVALLSAVYMLRASGLLDALTGVLAPGLRFLGIPPETAPLLFIRPISGSGALAAGSEIMKKFGPDSLIGRTAAVMLGSTETTFYTISVYFGSLGIRDTRYAIPAALCADLAGFVCAAFFTRLLWG